MLLVFYENIDGINNIDGNNNIDGINSLYKPIDEFV
jgi:hypothetical protein